MTSRKRRAAAGLCWARLAWHHRLPLSNRPLWSLVLRLSAVHTCALCRSKKVRRSADAAMDADADMDT